MLATVELSKDDIREALELLFKRRGFGEVVAFEIVPASEPDPPYAAPGQPSIRVRVDIGPQGSAT